MRKTKKTIAFNPGPLWRCRDGRLVPIAHMTDDHLLNTIRFLRDRVPVLRERLARGWLDDALTDSSNSSARQAFDNARFATFATDEQLLGSASARWRDLQAERRRRKLKELS